MVMAAFDDEGAIRTRSATELSVIDDISASLASTLRSLSIGTLHHFHSVTTQATGNTRAPTCPAPGEENAPPESSPPAAHGNSMARDDDSCPRESVKRPRCLNRETRRPHALKVDKPTVADLHSPLPTDTPTTRLVKTHLRNQSSRGVSTPAAAGVRRQPPPLAARVDLPGAAHEQLGKRPFSRLAISTYSKEERRPQKANWSNHAPRNVKWGRAGSAPFVGSPRGRMLASGRPDMIFPGDN